jgi:uncharacterized protein (TIGR03000 family)
MRRSLAVMGCWLVLVSVGRGDPPVYYEIPGSLPIPRPSHNVTDWGPLDYDDTPGAVPGGLVFARVGNQRVVRFGGALLPMRVRVRESGPDGPVTSRMVYPSSEQSSLVPLALQHQIVLSPPSPEAPPPGADLVRACVRVQMPDPKALLYLDGRETDTAGAVRDIQSPLLARGQPHVFRLLAAYKAGDNVLMLDREVVVRAGEVAAVSFDGVAALAVPSPRTRPKLTASQP